MNFMNAECERQFVDTNVLVYAHDAGAGAKRTLAAEILSELWESGLGCLSIQVLQEFFTIATRKLAHPLSSNEAAGVIGYLAQWQVHSPVAADVLAAIELAGCHQISFWDASIILSAQRLGCRTLWSEDLQHGGVYGDVVVRNPFGRADLVQEIKTGYTAQDSGSTRP